MSAWMEKGLLHLVKGDVTGGLDAADIKVALLESTYTLDQTDEIIGDVSPIAATSGNLTTVAVALVGGKLKFSADNVTFGSVAAGAACNAVMAYWDSGVAGTRYVLVYDSLAAPVTPDGNNINLTWGANGVATVTVTP